MRYDQSCENAKLIQNHKICAFQSTTFALLCQLYNLTPRPLPANTRPHAHISLHLCRTIAAHMPLIIYPPHTLFRLPMPRLPSKPYPTPLFNLNIPARFFSYPPPYTPILYPHFPPNPFPSPKTLARHSPTHLPTTLQPPPHIYLFPLSSTPQHNTTQQLSLPS